VSPEAARELRRPSLYHRAEFLFFYGLGTVVAMVGPLLMRPFR
jgi:hypothetical protein